MKYWIISYKWDSERKNLTFLFRFYTLVRSWEFVLVWYMLPVDQKLKLMQTQSVIRCKKDL